jgi:hypothetical protein
MCTLAAKTIWSSGWLGARIFRLQTNQMNVHRNVLDKVISFRDIEARQLRYQDAILSTRLTGSRMGLLIEGQTHLPWERIKAKPPPNYAQVALTLKGSEQKDAPVNERTQNATALRGGTVQRRTAAPVAERTFSEKPAERNSEQVPVMDYA